MLCLIINMHIHKVFVCFSLIVYTVCVLYIGLHYVFIHSYFVTYYCSILLFCLTAISLIKLLLLLYFKDVRIILCIMLTSLVESDSVLPADSRKYRLIRHRCRDVAMSLPGRAGRPTSASEAPVQRLRLSDGRAEQSRPRANYRGARNEPIISV